MSKTKFTPGPWVAKFKPNVAASEISYSGNNGKYVGMFSHSVGKHEDRKKWIEEGKANARLIAAAPEMYELLEQIAEGNETNFEYAKKSIIQLLNSINHE